MTKQPFSPLSLWYTEPASQWVEALPVGNGRLGAMVFGVIQSGFTYIKLDAFYQLMAMGAIIIGAVVLDQYRQRRAAART